MVWVALFFLLGYGAWDFQGGHLMIVAYFILSIIVYIFYAFLARCPSCRVPILLRPVKIFGMEIYLWSILPPAHCRHCGGSLS